MAAVATVTVRALEGVAVRTDLHVLAGGSQHVTAVAGPQLTAVQGALLEGGWKGVTG